VSFIFTAEAKSTQRIFYFCFPLTCLRQGYGKAGKSAIVPSYLISRPSLHPDSAG
jgi:hypothetical protein